MPILKGTDACREISNEQRFKAWWKENWKKVVAGALFIGGTILVIRNWDEISAIAEKLATTLKPSVDEIPHIAVPTIVEETCASPVREIAKDVVRKAPEAPFDVIAHIRNLPKNWHASPEKIAEAAELHIDLLPHQTLVDAYTKGIKAA